MFSLVLEEYKMQFIFAKFLVLVSILLFVTGCGGGNSGSGNSGSGGSAPPLPDPARGSVLWIFSDGAGVGRVDYPARNLVAHWILPNIVSETNYVNSDNNSSSSNSGPNKCLRIF